MPEFDSPMGGAQRKTLHIFVLADHSYSMKGERIESLNDAMEQVVPLLKASDDENSQCDLYLSVIPFSSGAVWQQKMTALADYEKWEVLSVQSATSLGAALELLSTVMNSAENPNGLGKWNAPPVILLITDGMPTDSFEKGMQEFEATGFGGKKSRTVRVALAVKGADLEVCERFTGNSELVFPCDNSEQLKQMIKWGTVTLSQAVSGGLSSTAGDGDEPELALPSPPPQIDDSVGGFAF